MRLLVSVFVVVMVFLAIPTAEACSCICDQKTQPTNATERRAQIRKTIARFDYAFIGEIVAIGDAEPLPAGSPPYAEPMHAITIKPSKIVKGPASEFIVVKARLGDGSNCLNELAVGDEFEGLAMLRDGILLAPNSSCDCDNWAIFYRGGPLATAYYRRSACN